MLKVISSLRWRQIVPVPTQQNRRFSQIWHETVQWSGINEPITCGPLIRRFPFPVLNLTPMVFTTSGAEFLEQGLPENAHSYTLPSAHRYTSFIEETSDHLDHMLDPNPEEMPVAAFQSYRPSERWNAHLHNHHLFFSRAETGILEIVADLSWSLMRTGLHLGGEDEPVYNEVQGELRAIHFTGRDAEAEDMLRVTDWLIKALVLGRTMTPHPFPRKLLQKYRQEHVPVKLLVEYSWLMHGSQGVFGTWADTLEVDRTSDWEESLQATEPMS